MPPEQPSENSIDAAVIERSAVDRQVTPRIAREVIGAWLGLLALWLLFELPTALRSGAIEPGAMRVSLDILALFTLWGVTVVSPRARPLRIALVAVALCLLVFRIDQLIFTLLMREEPLLYDQWFMLRHLVVLISDLMSFGSLLAVAGTVIGVGLLVWLVRLVMRRARVLLTPERRGRTVTIVTAMWALGLTVAHVPHAPGAEPRAHWLTLSIVDNLSTSIATYRSIQGNLAESPYRRYADIALTDKPDVLLFIVESYGRILSTDASLREAHASLLTRLQAELAGSGWQMASAFGRSSVSGGRSWIAEGSIVLGTSIRYEAVFQHLVSHAGTTPNLVSFLAGQGYETVLLAPADRERGGFRKENRYGFDQILQNESLDYRGPQVGWGIVPDAYSLNIARERVLEPRTRPLFFDFHMVTSHAPWVAPPGVSGSTQKSAPMADEHTKDERTKQPHTLAMRRLKLYERSEDSVYTFTSPLVASMRNDYQVTIRYDLELITDYLKRRDRDALVIILGDHQPPVITNVRDSFDTPIHILTRDAGRLRELRAHGFVDGLSIPDDAKPAIAHAGLFSSIVRTLASRTEPPVPLPPVLPEGVVLVP